MSGKLTKKFNGNGKILTRAQVYLPLALVFLLVSITCAWAGGWSGYVPNGGIYIRGHVGGTGQSSLPGATVHCTGLNIDGWATTDNSGNYTIGPLYTAQPQQVTITASHSGYSSQTVKRDISLFDISVSFFLQK